MSLDDILQAMKQGTGAPAKAIPVGPKHECLGIFNFDSNEVLYMMLAAAACMKDKRFEKALEIYETVEMLAPSWGQAVSGRGVALHSLHRIDEAEEAYRAAMELEPNNQEAHLYLGELLCFERKDKENGQRHLGTAEALEADSALGRRATLMLYLIRGNQPQDLLINSDDQTNTHK